VQTLLEMSSNNISALGSILSGVVAILALSVAIKSLRHNETGSIAITLEWCNVRYVELDKLRLKLNKAYASGLQVDPEKEAKHYFERLWELHYIEYHLYTLGLIPVEIYGLWLWIRNRDYHEEHASVGRLSQVEGWKCANEYLHDHKFETFIEEFLLERKNLNKVRAQLRQLKKVWLVRKLCGEKCG
jgi:hypothetical protein